MTDLEKIPRICIETSDEDDVSEYQYSFRSDVKSFMGMEKDFTSVLHERTEKLQLEINSLREKLNEEVALCRKEKEEFQVLREKSDALAFEEANAAAIAAAAAYAVESPLVNDLDNTMDIMSEPNMRELTILEYERNLAKYQDLYVFEQAEQRYNSYKRALVDTYKQKLSEVERLCNEELEKIRHSATTLQPFKEIALQWHIDENNHGDSNRICNDQSNVEQFKLNESSCSNDRCLLRKIDDEVNMAPEILSARLKLM